MSKTKSINDLITELQAENEQAKYFIKLFNMALKETFGADEKTIRRALEEYKNKSV